MSYVKASIYLTFNDGPDMQLTPEQARNLRDILIEAVGLPGWAVERNEVEVQGLGSLYADQSEIQQSPYTKR